MNEHGNCPNCNMDFDGGSIWEHFFKEKGDELKADRIAEMYGATRESGRWSKKIGISDLDLDRVTHWKCPECEHVWERQ